eukprot:5395895-Pleurochrysis_carterae.AAC.1
MRWRTRQRARLRRLVRAVSAAPPARPHACAAAVRSLHYCRVRSATRAPRRFAGIVRAVRAEHARTPKAGQPASAAG